MQYIEFESLRFRIIFPFFSFKDQNKTLLWFAIQKEVNTSLTEKLIDVQQQIIKLDQKVIGTRAE